MKKPVLEGSALDRVSMRRIAGLDGLRAIAAGLVLVFHLVPGWAGLGYVGVDIFFVLSGFLITSLLLVSTLNHGRPRLADFWARRFRRLFPAVVVATTGSAALAFFVGGDALVALGRQVVGSLTATYNWAEIAGGSSYFEQSSPLLLTNMWSLAVEQQFYLFWPLIVLLLVKLRRHWQIAAALAIAGVSITLHVALLTDDVTRVYMGTDTHLWGLMFGAALAFAMQRTVIGAEVPGASRIPAVWGIGGWLGLIGVAAAGLVLPDSMAMYPWGMVGASVLAVLVIRAVLPDVQGVGADSLRRFLGNKTLSWLGVRSYGIYLWHWPLYVLLYYQQPMLNTYAAALIVVISSILLAHLSYRCVENPIRVMGFEAWFRHQRERVSGFSVLTAISAVSLPLVVAAFAVAGVAVAPAMSSGQQAVAEGQKNDGRDPGKGGEPAIPMRADDEQLDEQEPGAESDAASLTEGPTGSPHPSPGTPSPTREPAPDPLPHPTGDVMEGPSSWDQVTIIGDSVVLAAQYPLEETMPGVVVDAKESRSIKAAPQLISHHAAGGTLGDYVVISLATNAKISDTDIDAIVAAVGPDRTVVFVTAFGPARVSWISDSNEAITSGAERHAGRVYVADWSAAIEDRTDLLAGDAIHPGREAAEIYAETIKKTLSP